MKIENKKSLWEGKYMRKPYNIVIVASKKAAKDNIFMWEYFLIRNGTKELNRVLAKE